MNVYVYSDESGVFDKKNNEYFVFGGLIFLGDEQKDKWTRMYRFAENVVRQNLKVPNNYEIKANKISNKQKYSLFRSLNRCYKFAIVIDQLKVLDRIFESKKDKQRYLDYAFKIGIKRAFQNLINDKILIVDDIDRIYFYIDQHTTATNGLYELQESLEQEFKRGTYNMQYSIYYPPIFSNICDINLKYCDSKSKILIRAADIVANRIYYLSKNNLDLNNLNNFNIIWLP